MIIYKRMHKYHIEEAAKFGSLGRFSLSLLSQHLTHRYSACSDGTFIHVAAKHNRLDMVPSSLMTMKNLAQRDALGRSAFHLAGLAGNIRQCPASLLTPAMIGLRDNLNETVAHACVHGDCHGDLPINSLLAVADNLSALGTTIFHDAATLDRIDRFPDCLLSPKALTNNGGIGKSPFDILGDKGLQANLAMRVIFRLTLEAPEVVRSAADRDPLLKPMFESAVEHIEKRRRLQAVIAAMTCP